MDLPVRVEPSRIAEYCERWKIAELAVFGSALRPDFRPDSDIDVLVTFLEGADWSLLDMIRMERDLVEILGRAVDLVDRRSILRSRNWLRREEILKTAVRLYAA